MVQEIVRSLVSITVAERRVSTMRPIKFSGNVMLTEQRLHLSVQEHVWAKIAQSHESLVDIVTAELVHAAIDSGFGTDKSECAADVLVSMGGTVVRGRIIARLRKVSYILSYINVHKLTASSSLGPI